jgi:hypothetical protein
MTSTVLSLLVIPSVFTLVDDLEHSLGWLKRKLLRQPPVHREPVPGALRHESP